MDASAENTLQDSQQIIALIHYAIDHGQPVVVNLPNDPQSYFTSLVAKKSDEKTAADQGLWLTLNPLGPPQGNHLIQGASEVHLRFFTDDHKVTFAVPFMETAEDRRIRLAFPAQVQVAGQSRQAPRFKTEKKFDSQLKLLAAEGKVYPIKVQDISRGGISFYGAEDALPVKDFTTVTLQGRLPSLEEVVLQVRVVGSKITHKGHLCHRATFLTNSEQERQQLHALVDHMIEHAKLIQKPVAE